MEPTRVAQTSPIFTLSTDMVLYLGKMIPDVKSVVAFTSTCTTFNGFKFRLLTADASKIQHLLSTVLLSSAKTFPPEFLEGCQVSVHRDFPFYVSCLPERKAYAKKTLVPVLPNVTIETDYFVPNIHSVAAMGPPPSPIFHRILNLESITKPRYMKMISDIQKKHLQTQIEYDFPPLNTLLKTKTSIEKHFSKLTDDNSVNLNLKALLADVTVVIDNSTTPRLRI